MSYNPTAAMWGDNPAERMTDEQMIAHGCRPHPWPSPFERARIWRGTLKLCTLFGRMVAAGITPYAEAEAEAIGALFNAGCVPLDDDQFHDMRNEISDAIANAATATDRAASRRIAQAIEPLIAERAQSADIMAAARRANALKPPDGLAVELPDAEIVAIVKEHIRAALAADRCRKAAHG